MPVLTMSLILLPTAAAALLMRRLAGNPFVRLLGASFDIWAERSRAGPELVQS